MKSKSLTGAVAVLMTVAQAGAADAQTKVSAPGKYEGYSPALYDGFERTSIYIPMRDGTRLAADIHRPTLKGKVVDTPLPVIWMHTPYNRRGRGGRPPAVESYAGSAARLIKYGYVAVTVDFRGLYASYGVNHGYNRGEWHKDAWWDAYDVTEWLAKQPWSTGKIGMWGCSATGGSQMHAAVTAPPHLRAIVPMSSEFDVYRWAGREGVNPVGEPTRFSGSTQAERDRDAAPVDGPDGPALLAAAIASQKGGVGHEGYTPFRDSPSKEMEADRWWLTSSPHVYADTIRKSGIGLLAATNWNERWTKYGAFYKFNNLPGQVKVLAAPQAHCRWDLVLAEQKFDIAIEEQRFFDYWLKGIQNGVMTEAPITYYTYNAPAGREWRTATKWPLPAERRMNLYLGEGALLPAPPKAAGADERVTNYATTQENRAAKGLVYETPPLSADLEVTGHSTMDLWVSSTGTDGDFIVNLDDVAPDGKVTNYHMYGMLRASRRALAKAPYKNMGLPWHSHMQADARPLKPGEATELQFDILPISYIFKQGHKIRVVVQLADAERSTKLSPAPTVKILRGAAHPSHISLPVIPAG